MKIVTDCLAFFCVDIEVLILYKYSLNIPIIPFRYQMFAIFIVLKN